MNNILQKIKIPLYIFTGIILTVYLTFQIILFLPHEKTNRELFEISESWPQFKSKIITDIESYGYYSIRENKELEDMIQNSNDQYYIQKMKEQ